MRTKNTAHRAKSVVIAGNGSGKGKKAIIREANGIEEALNTHLQVSSGMILPKVTTDLKIFVIMPFGNKGEYQGGIEESRSYLKNKL
jgi:hypothetical protein